MDLSLGRFGDARRARTGSFLLERLVTTGGCGITVRSLGGDRAGEMQLTRFLRNEAVTAEEMAAEAAAGTARRCRGRHVLAIQDTTVVKSTGGGGLYLHPVVAVDATDDVLLGLIDACFLSREAGKRHARRARPIEEKESYRWLIGAERAAAVCAAAARVTVIADRESDIYEALARCPAGTDLLIRAAQDRSLEGGESLFAQLDGLPPAGQVALDLPARPGHKARTATVAVRFARFDLARPRHGVHGDLPASVPVQVVDVREVDAPAGAPVLHWRLLTTQPVRNTAEALAVVDLYRRRWMIEQLFRTLKSQGFDIEKLRIGEDEPRCKLVMAALIAAVIVQQLVHAREGRRGPGPLRPLTDAFEPDDIPVLKAFCDKLEGKTQRQKNPHPEGSLAYAAWVCARLGGWTGYYGKPGPVVMLRGWLYFQSAKQGFLLKGQMTDV